jgi:hypothetical protein
LVYKAHIFQLSLLEGDVTRRLPDNPTGAATHVVHELSIKMSDVTARTGEVTADIGVLPLDEGTSST